LFYCVTAHVPVYHEAYPFGGAEEVPTFDVHRPTEPEQEYIPHSQKCYTSTITISPPQHFKPVPIYQEHAPPKAAPPTVPPKPFKDTSVFQAVDTHAVQVCIVTI